MSADPGVAQQALQHERLRAEIRARIDSGEWAAGMRILSEREMCEHFGISRTTARRVIGDLVHEGALRAVAGKGTFVATARLHQELRALTGFSEDMRRRGLDLATRVLAFETRKARADEADALMLGASAEIHVLKRIRSSGGKPIAIQLAMLPAAICPGLDAFDFARISLFRVLSENYGLHLARGETKLSAGLARADELALLSLRKPAAVLRSDQITWLDDGRPIERCMSSFRSDFKLTTNA